MEPGIGGFLREVDVVVGPQYANRLADVLSESLTGRSIHFWRELPRYGGWTASCIAVAASGLSALALPF